MDLSSRFDILSILVNAMVLFTAIPVHECAHALAADKLGDSTPRNQGRITLNPFAHLTLWGSLMLVFAGFGWGKPVQVNPNNFKNPKRDNAVVALAGPCSNMIMAFVCTIIYKLIIFNAKSDIATYAALVFYLAMSINVGLGVFNLLPIPPLDGSKIFGAILPEKAYFTIMRYERFIVIGLIVLLYSGLLSTPLSFLQDCVFTVMDFLTRWVDLIFAN